MATRPAPKASRRRPRAVTGRSDQSVQNKPYRVFISYSHDDLPLVRTLTGILKSFAEPMWDENFLYGHGFHDQIRMFIAHSHVFLPVITESSSRRGWVHQEIGYAMGMRVPIIPGCTDVCRDASSVACSRCGGIWPVATGGPAPMPTPHCANSTCPVATMSAATLRV